MEVDFVYLWVDGNDPIWQAKRNALIGKTEEKSAVNCDGRYADNDELKYSLRSQTRSLSKRMLKIQHFPRKDLI